MDFWTKEKKDGFSYWGTGPDTPPLTWFIKSSTTRRKVYIIYVAILCVVLAIVFWNIAKVFAKFLS